MKKWMSLVLLLCMTAAYSQPAAKPQRFSAEDYLQKSRRQKTIGFVLLVTGGAAMAPSVPFFIKASGDRSLNGLDVVGVALLFGGGGTLLTLTSIPLFAASGKNKRKAAALSGHINVEMGTWPLPAGAGVQMLPSLSLRLQLSR